MIIEDIIKKIKSKSILNKEEIRFLFDYFEKDNLKKEDVISLLHTWNERGYNAEELKHFLDLIFSRSPQKILSKDSIDVCGTGGDKLNTFNISTIVAIVLSSMGEDVIKHSGRKSTGISGSVDILSAFNLDIDASVEKKENCFYKHRLMFITSPVLKEVFSNIKLLSKEINIPGLVNLLGPLCNPYKNNFHLLGVSNPAWGELVADTYKLINSIGHALIICSNIGENIFLDELSFSKNNFLWSVNSGIIKKEKLDFSSLIKENFHIDLLKVQNENNSKKTFEKILKNELDNPGLIMKSNVMALNVGAALFLRNKTKSIEDGFYFAQEYVKNGKVWEHFNDFRNCISGL